MSRATLGEIQAAARRREGLPDRRDRDPMAAAGYQLPWGSPPLDLIEMLALDAAITEQDHLMIGVAIQGGQGTCTTCHHAMVCHKDARWRCETCDGCRKFVRQPRRAGVA